MKQTRKRRPRHAAADAGQDRRDAGATPTPAPVPVGDPRTWLVAAPLALFVLAAFLPVLDNGFVHRDDDVNFLKNPYYRGLGATQVKWAWTTFRLGVYQPVGWLLLEAQYAAWKLDPR